ncbi:MAG: hypothetical protein N4A38_05015 [Candidatus Gracilibacteria bacterium]|nr:hypothetical protein [Candidatus Gracilibacteria bacterium]
MLEKRGVINKEKKNKELLSEFLLKEYLKGKEKCKGDYCDLIFGKYDLTTKTIEKFEQGQKNTSNLLTGIIDMHNGTRGGGKYDLKRIWKKFGKNGYVYIVGQKISLSNLGNILCGFNLKNSLITTDLGELILMDVETINYKEHGFEEFSRQRAFFDEVQDYLFYVVGYWLAENFNGSMEDKIKNLGLAIISAKREYKQILPQIKRDFEKFKENVIKKYPNLDFNNR